MKNKNIQKAIGELPSDVNTNCSFHYVILKTTVSKLRKLLGLEHIRQSIHNKTQFEWEYIFCYNNNKYWVTIYDYKEYRKFKLTDEIQFHIGGANENVCIEFKKSLISEGL